MSAVQIDRRVYETELAKLRQEYDGQLGGTEGADVARSYARHEFVALYARNIAFWQAREPDVDPDHIRMELLAQHAICSNAAAQLRRHVLDVGVSADELERAVTRELARGEHPAA